MSSGIFRPLRKKRSMESFCIKFSEDHSRLFPLFLWMVVSLNFIANAQPNERTSDYEMSLTCIFVENLNDRKPGFKILDGQSDVALQCSWREGKLYCTLGDGFIYDLSRSDKVAVRKIVPAPEPSSCSCFLADHDQNDHERPCLAEVRPIWEARGRPQLNDKPAEDNPSQNSHSEGASANPQPLEPSSHSLILVATLLGAMLVAAIAAALILFVKLRRTIEWRNQERAAPENLRLSR